MTEDAAVMEEVKKGLEEIERGLERLSMELKETLRESDRRMKPIEADLRRAGLLRD